MEDRVFVTANAVILLDGATDPDATDQDGGWLADQLGQHLTRALVDNPGLELTDALAEAIRATADRNELEPVGCSTLWLYSGAGALGLQATIAIDQP